MKDNGSYIKLYRKITDWEWYTDIPTKALFIHILLRASAKGRKYRGVDVPIGSFTTSIEILASETGLTKQNVRTALNKLKSTGEITCEVTNQYTKIFVIKWGDYQSYVDVDNTQTNKQLTIDQHTTNTRLTTIKESKESKEREIKRESKAFKKPTLQEINDYIHQESLNVDGQSWLDYYESNGWKVGRNQMRDWKACLRRWNKTQHTKKTMDDFLANTSIQEMNYDDSNNPEFTKQDMEALLERRQRNAG